MTTNRVQKLPGMRDVSISSFNLNEVATSAISKILINKGYEQIDTPLLEEAELFVRKFGGELTSRIYTFLDPGGNRVSLRPEFTSSVIRNFIEMQPEATLPLRLQYHGPVFRYESQNKNNYRQFTQIGAELIGAEGVDADTEAISLAWMAIQETGLKHFEMRIGHIGVLHDLLTNLGISEPAKIFVLNNIQMLKTGETYVSDVIDRAHGLGLFDNKRSLNTVETDATRNFVHGFVSKAISSPLGRRSTERIVDRLIRKTRETDDPDRLRNAVEFVCELIALDDNPHSTLKNALQITESRGLNTTVLLKFNKLLESLLMAGVVEKQLKLDFGISGNVAYYTGVLFELTSTYPKSSIKLCTGGRYDSLVKALGGKNVPALGFAYNLENVITTLSQESGTLYSQVTDNE